MPTPPSRSPSSRCLAAILMAGCFAWPGGAGADIIHLKDGRVLRGRAPSVTGSSSPVRTARSGFRGAWCAP